MSKVAATNDHPDGDKLQGVSLWGWDNNPEQIRAMQHIASAVDTADGSLPPPASLVAVN